MVLHKFLGWCVYQNWTADSNEFVHSGGALKTFCPAVYSFMCGMSPSDIIVSSGEVPDEIIRDFLEKVCLHVIFSYTHITSKNMKALILWQG